MQTPTLTRPTVASAHPVAPEVRLRIVQALDEIEAQHCVKVLFACESGSRGWGFASPDSDYDVRFVYVNRLSWYLRCCSARCARAKPNTVRVGRAFMRLSRTNWPWPSRVSTTNVRRAM